MSFTITTRRPNGKAYGICRFGYVRIIVAVPFGYIWSPFSHRFQGSRRTIACHFYNIVKKRFKFSSIGQMPAFRTNTSNGFCQVTSAFIATFFLYRCSQRSRIDCHRPRIIAAKRAIDNTILLIARLTSLIVIVQVLCHPSLGPKRNRLIHLSVTRIYHFTIVNIRIQVRFFCNVIRPG